MKVRKLDSATAMEVYDVVRADDVEPGLMDVRFVHVQSIPAVKWVVVHGLGKSVDVEVVDSSGRVIEAEVIFIDENQLEINLNKPIAGRVIIT